MSSLICLTGWGNSLPYWCYGECLCGAAIAFMALWLLCCVLLFITSRGYVWLSHQSWFLAPELSLPWLVLGGLGLAIASNRSAWAHASVKLPTTTRSQVASSPPPSLQPSTADVAGVSPVTSRKPLKPHSSISFEISTAKAIAHHPPPDVHQN